MFYGGITWATPRYPTHTRINDAHRPYRCTARGVRFPPPAAIRRPIIHHWKPSPPSSAACYTDRSPHGAWSKCSAPVARCSCFVSPWFPSRCAAFVRCSPSGCREIRLFRNRFSAETCPGRVDFTPSSCVCTLRIIATYQFSITEKKEGGGVTKRKNPRKSYLKTKLLTLLLDDK